MALTPDPLSAYRKLRRGNAAPYAAFLMVDPTRALPKPSNARIKSSDGDGVVGQVGGQEDGGGSGTEAADGGVSKFAVCCSSPERFLRVSRDGWVESKPIKGTAKRIYGDPTADEAVADQLRTSEKGTLIIDKHSPFSTSVHSFGSPPTPLCTHEW